jgi:hypothetical protein
MSVSHIVLDCRYEKCYKEYGIFAYLLSEVGVAGTVAGVEEVDLRLAAAFNLPIFM